MALALSACGGGATYRQVRPTEALAAWAGPVSAEVGRVFLTDDTIDNGLGDGAGLVVELTVANAGRVPYKLAPTAIWCLMQLDPGRPGETRMLPPSVNGDGPFPGAPPQGETGGELSAIEVPPGGRRAFWVLFRGYRYDGSDVPRRVALTLDDGAGHSLEVVLADPARGELRWDVAPTRSGWTYGVQGGSLYGGYVQATSFSQRIARLTATGRFLWDLGFVSSTLIQVQGPLRSTSSSFTGIGLEAHLALPLWRFGDPRSPWRLGPYLGGQIQTLPAMEPTPKQTTPPPPTPAIYGQGGPEAGLEFDMGALRPAATPFPLSQVGANPLPRWSFRIGYTHAWIAHGTGDGYYSSVRFAW